MTRGERDRLRRRRAIGEHDAIAGAAQRLRDSVRELAREKAAIEADGERIAIDSVRRTERARRDGDRVADEPDVVEGERLGDDGAPAVGAEGDGSGHAAHIVGASVAQLHGYAV